MEDPHPQESLSLSQEMKSRVMVAQRNEITEHLIYEKLSRATADQNNRDVLAKISKEELWHYNFWKKHTGEEIKPDLLRVWKYVLISKVLGITFGVKLMERGELIAQAAYDEISKAIPSAKEVMEDEEEHEKQLILLIDEERLRYIGSIVLGLNDALVELTGALAGFTLALQQTNLIATTGLITGIAASLSMSASEYLSTKSEGGSKNPFRASAYTGAAYVTTVFFLILPYLLLSNVYLALGITLLEAITMILFFSFYVAVARDVPFKKRFLEMAGISLGVAALSFAIGYLVRSALI